MFLYPGIFLFCLFNSKKVWCDHFSERIKEKKFEWSLLCTKKFRWLLKDRTKIVFVLKHILLSHNVLLILSIYYRIHTDTMFNSQIISFPDACLYTKFIPYIIHIPSPLRYSHIRWFIIMYGVVIKAIFPVYNTHLFTSTVFII